MQLHNILENAAFACGIIGIGGMGGVTLADGSLTVPALLAVAAGILFAAAEKERGRDSPDDADVEAYLRTERKRMRAVTKKAAKRQKKSL